MKALNKIYVVVDTEVEKKDGFNKAIISKPFSTISRPRVICAVKNLMFSEDRRYVVQEIPLISSDKRYIFKIKDEYASRMKTHFNSRELPNQVMAVHIEEVK